MKLSEEAQTLPSGKLTFWLKIYLPVICLPCKTGMSQNQNLIIVVLIK